MKTVIAFLTVAVFVPSVSFGQSEKHELRMSLDDTFVVKESEKWSIAVEKLLELRFANVKILPKKNHSFSLMLYFKCDTSDLAQYDTPQKMERALKSSSEKYLSNAVETKVDIKKLTFKGRYGFSTVLTDKELANQTTIPAGQFKYITRGMIRLSPDSALGFSLMTNSLDSTEYKELMDYIASFVKE
ncbi:MAG: hypothetical protein ABFC88_13555 [Thermoguttaceae bacterium]